MRIRTRLNKDLCLFEPARMKQNKNKEQDKPFYRSINYYIIIDYLFYDRLYRISLAAILFSLGETIFDVPGLRSEVYSLDGDVNIGGLLRVRSAGLVVEV